MKNIEKQKAIESIMSNFKYLKKNDDSSVTLNVSQQYEFAQFIFRKSQETIKMTADHIYDNVILMLDIASKNIPKEDTDYDFTMELMRLIKDKTLDHKKRFENTLK